MTGVAEMGHAARWLGAGAAVLAGVLLAAPAGAQPSFDCAAATLPAETTICAVPALAKLDQQIATVYFALLESAGPTQSAQLRHEQRAFLRERNACAAGATPLETCLGAVMRERLGALQALRSELSGAPTVSGGTVTSAPGVQWQAARPGDTASDAYRLEDGRLLCAAGLPERPVVGTVAADAAQGCVVARAGAAESAFHVLIAGAGDVAWVPAASAAQTPDHALELWREGDEAVQVCRATIDGATRVGTLNLRDSCAVLVEHADGRTEEILLLAGFEVMARPQ